MALDVSAAAIQLLERATYRSFAALATLRGARGLHPRGATFTGRATLHEAGRPLTRAPEVSVVVRLSRGIGLPHPLPDFNGIAIRFIDARGSGHHQDLLLAAAGSAPFLRHLIVPLPTLDASGYSTILTYRDAHGGRRVFRCSPVPRRTLTDATSSLPLNLDLFTASPLGRWRPAARVTLTAVASEHERDIRFDPWMTGEELTPYGWLNRLRAPAYRGSRAGAPPQRLASAGSCLPGVRDPVAWEQRHRHNTANGGPR